MTETASSSFCFIKHLHFEQCWLLMLSDNHLRYPLSVINDKRFVGEVDKYDAHFSAIVSVNSAWRVQHGDALLYCKSAAWSNLRLIPCWQSHKKTCRYKNSGKRGKSYWLFEIGTQIHACRLLCSILRQSMMRFIYNSNFHNVQIWCKVSKTLLKSPYILEKFMSF